MSVSIGAVAGSRGTKAASSFTWSRIAKLGGAATVLAVGAYAVMSDMTAIATDNAVVSAYAVSLRTPIDGMVDMSSLHVGDRVERGMVLARIANGRVDDQRLVDLRGALVREEVHLASVDAERAALASLRQELLRRSQVYLGASADRLAGSIDEALNVAKSIEARRALAGQTLARRKSLAQDGHASAADVERAQADFDAATHDGSAQQGRLASLRAQAAAIANGVVAEPGSNDVAYSTQRADEIAIRLDELTREGTDAAANISDTKARLASEETRIANLRAATIVAPKSGIIWKLDASDGERAGVGGTIAQIVDCRSAFILAVVPQKKVSDIAVGSLAQYRFSGDETQRFGRVLSVTGDATGGDRNLAAMPFAQSVPTATVRIAVDPGSDQCPVGRTARAVLPSAHRGVLAWLTGLWS